LAKIVPPVSVPINQKRPEEAALPIVSGRCAHRSGHEIDDGWNYTHSSHEHLPPTGAGVHDHSPFVVWGNVDRVGILRMAGEPANLASREIGSEDIDIARFCWVSDVRDLSSTPAEPT
jgi:hypothetical protein